MESACAVRGQNLARTFEKIVPRNWLSSTNYTLNFSLMQKIKVKRFKRCSGNRQTDRLDSSHIGYRSLRVSGRQMMYSREKAQLYRLILLSIYVYAE